jgi:two-component system, NtrC family, sensor kinase
MVDAAKLNTENITQEAIHLLGKLNDSRLGLEDCQGLFLVALSQIFDNEFSILLLTDSEGGTRAIKRTAKKGETGIDSGEVEFNSGILHQCYQDLKLIDRKVDGAGEINPTVDSVPGVDLKSIVCAPLIYQSQLFGILAIGNPPDSPLNSFYRSIFTMFLDALAGRTYSTRLIEQLEDNNAELLSLEQQLLNSRNTLRTLFDNIPESFYIIDKDYHLIAINQSRADRADGRPQELVGQMCYSGLYHLYAACPGCLVSKTFTSKKPQLRKVHYLQKDRSSQEWEIHAYPVPDEDGRSDQVILLEENITEKRRLEAELIQSEKLAAVGQLAAGVAHEINNPLTSIIANAQMLVDDLPDDQVEMKQSARLIEMAGLKATQVVRNLLGSVRKEEFNFIPLDLNESIQSALMLLSHEFLSNEITIRFDRGKDMPQITASENYLQSIWVNLIMNAIEAIETKPGEISITTKFDGKNFLVKIHDSGVGIPNEYIGQIFEPFFTTKHDQRGTGLGLSLVRRVVEVHNGQIMVESEEGKGATFTIVLPKEVEIDSQEVV